MKKYALVVGHTSTKDKGAYSENMQISEFDYNLKVAQAIQAMCPEMFDIYTHETQDYYMRQKGLAYKLNQKNYDAVFELHFNAASPIANGTECCYYFASKKGLAIAQAISLAVMIEFNTRLRGDQGAKPLVNKNDRGYWFTYLPKAPAVIIESFFGSNTLESEKFRDINRYAKTLFNAIKNL